MTSILEESISKIQQISADKRSALNKLHIRTIRDLLWTFPVRFADVSVAERIESVPIGSTVTVYGVVSKIISNPTHSSLLKIVVIDLYGDSVSVVWFNATKIRFMIVEGQSVMLTGVLSQYKGKRILQNPRIERKKGLPVDVGNTLFNERYQEKNIGLPVYPETHGITSAWLHECVKKALAIVLPHFIIDPIPDHIRNQFNLPDLVQALRWIHVPHTAEQYKTARKRFAFEYLWLIQVARMQARALYAAAGATNIVVPESTFTRSLESLGFPLTVAQFRVIESIRHDMARDTPMARLVEGDVGSGKTAIAALAAQLVVSHDADRTTLGEGYNQVAYMAPTEILAVQLYESFIQFFRSQSVSIVLLTGSLCRKFPSKTDVHTWTTISKSQALKWIKNGEIAIVIGTHALIQKRVQFRNLGLVIVDEQHRFGTRQRGLLAQKDGHVPHYLSMSATPMPRTLALTVYGDLDISIIDELPPGRKTVITKLILPSERQEMYGHIRRELDSGRQIYFICPRIDDSEDTPVTMPSVVRVARELQQVFPNQKITMLHGKLTPAAKDSIMSDFAAGKVNILVATSVIEVGVNVPNATNIVIEGAQRFGLAQLHQLRGRVQRGDHQPYCFVSISNQDTEITERLQIFTSVHNGFDLAERDLLLRGTGDLAGMKQWGVTDIGMEAIQNIRLVEAVRTVSRDLIAADPELSNYPALRDHLASKNFEIHLE